MLFVELVFLPFFLVVLAVHWGLRGARARKVWLLAASCVFYGAWDWRFLGLIGASTLLDYGVGLMLAGPGGRRRFFLWLSLVGNLGLLGFFKYFGFFVDSAVALLAQFGVEAHRPTLAIVLPVGISFYTFQTLSYTLDVYRGTLAPVRSLLDFALFVTFFPQLVAGPIVRASEFLPQLETPRRFAGVDVRGAALLFLIGFFKKACLADNLAPWVDRYFSEPAAFDALSAWIAVPAYAVQIYCDFSGYSEMASACAALLGYALPVNFLRPYLATNLVEFWRRWHVSLSTWLRDYLYVPLGGNRGPRWKTHRNLLVTMLLGGLWHGASWNFVVWGGLHGLLLAALRAWGVSGLGGAHTGTVRRVAGMALTFVFVCACWIFFRAQGLHDAFLVTRSFFGFSSGGEERLPELLAALLAGATLVHVIAAWRGSRLTACLRGLPGPVFWAAIGTSAGLALLFVPVEARPFIYFQF